MLPTKAHCKRQIHKLNKCLLPIRFKITELIHHSYKTNSNINKLKKTKFRNNNMKNLLYGMRIAHCAAKSKSDMSEFRKKKETKKALAF